MKQREGQLDGLLALLLLGVFALCILAVLLTGAGVYQRLTERGRTSGDSRTAAQYVATRVRQADAVGAVALEPFGDGDALVLTEDLEGTVCRTWVYCHEGWLRELFGDAAGDFAPEDGEKVLAAENLDLTLRDGCLTADITVAGATEQVVLLLRSGEEAVP